jgi:hypothetical protein
MRYVADKSEPMACTNHLSAESSEPVMRDHAGLEIANIVWGVVHELDVPDAALVRFLEPLELPLKKIQSFNVAHYGRSARCVRGFQIRRRKRAPQPMMSDHLIYPIKAAQMILIELARLRGAQRCQDPGRIPSQDRTVRNIRKASDGQ